LFSIHRDLAEEITMTNKNQPGRKALMLTGVTLVAVGALALFSPVAAGEWVVRLSALVLTVTGIVQVVQAVRGGGGLGGIFAGLLGLIVAGVGVMIWLNPELGSGVLTALLMVFFIVHGFWKLSSAFRFRQIPGWTWLALSGLLSLLFVYLLWAQWPLSGAWAIGILVGLDILLTGIAMIVVARRARLTRSSGYVDTISL
jgi:uncharacterized membrane protein HdeD (DUF308 family)